MVRRKGSTKKGFLLLVTCIIVVCDNMIATDSTGPNIYFHASRSVLEMKISGNHWEKKDLV